MKVTAKKFNAIVTILLVLVIQIVIYGELQGNNQSTDSSLMIASGVCLAVFIVEVISWKKLTNELLSPYIVFLFVLFVFCCGQSIGWFTGIEMGSKNMWNRIDHGVNRALLLRGLCYSSLGITCFHLGACVVCDMDKRVFHRKAPSTDNVEYTFRNLGRILLFICIPAFLATSLTNVYVVMQGGYGAIYTHMESSSALIRVSNMLSNYYQPCLLLLLIAYRKETNRRRFIVFAMLLEVIVNLYIGGRSSAVMPLLAIVLAYHYFVKPFTKKKILIGGIAGYFGIAVLNTIADIRGNVGRSLADIFLSLGASLTNVIGEFVGELGWSITSVCWTMNLVPSSYPFRYGMSYLVSLISWVPSFFFSGIHPVTKWGELSSWLQTALGMSYGPGYTMVAEAYLNYGEFGYIAMFVEGMIVASVIARVSRKHTEADLLGATYQIMVIMTIMNALVRSSVSFALRQTVLVILPLYILIRVSMKRNAK